MPECSVKRCARTDPAVPPPMMTKSYDFFATCMGSPTSKAEPRPKRHSRQMSEECRSSILERKVLLARAPAIAASKVRLHK